MRMGLSSLRAYNWLLVIPLLAGILLMAAAWFLSYPLLIISADDWIFNHISVLYWIGLPLTLVSFFGIGLTSRSNTVHFVVSLGIFFAIYSLSYYYSMLPGSDAQLFRGLHEYYAESNSLVPDNKWHYYYEWPLFFVFTRSLVVITGLGLVQLEFLTYTLIGFLTVLGLHLYFSAYYKNLAFLPVVGFSIATFNFINYQAVPFSLACSLLFIMFALEKRFEPNDLVMSKTILLLLLFVGISFIHLFVSVFFILYLLIQYFLSKKPMYLRLSLFTIVMYIAVQLFQAPTSLSTNSKAIMDNILSSDISKVFQQTFSSNFVPLDTVAQVISRITFVLVALICGLGFLILFWKKRLSTVDKAFFLSGLVYLIIGNFLPILGSRAISLVFIPISLGVFSFLQGRKAIVLKTAFLICLVLFTFISIHRTFIDEVHFQTKEAYSAENFMLNNFAWNTTAPPKVIIDFRQQNYLVAFQAEGAYFYGEQSANFSELYKYDCIILTLGLEKILATRNTSIGDSIENSSFNLIYSNGFTSSYINAER